MHRIFAESTVSKCCLTAGRTRPDRPLIHVSATEPSPRDGTKSLNPRVGGCVLGSNWCYHPCQGEKAPTLIERRYTSTQTCRCLKTLRVSREATRRDSPIVGTPPRSARAAHRSR
jgi:hypothetical protein